MNGKPVEAATVSFWAPTAPRAATGTTDAEGKFQLSMFSLNDGAIEGTHVITVTKVDTASQAGSTPMDATPTDPNAMTQSYVDAMKAMEKNKGKKGAIPAIYASREQTPLKETVTKGADNSFVIQLVE